MDSTGLRKIHIVGGDGDQSAVGLVDANVVVETRPCYLCHNFERDTKRLVEHLLAHGLKPEPDGCFVSPIAKDFKDPRANMRLDPKKAGYCKLNLWVAQDVATCPSWTLQEGREGLVQR